MTGERFRQCFPGMDGPVLIGSEENLFYTLGFSTTARRPAQIAYSAALLWPGRALFFCPANWAEVAAGQIGRSGVEIVPYTGGNAGLTQSICEALGPGASRLGYERDGLALPLYLALSERRGDIVWEDVSPALRRARCRKGPAEIAALRESAALARRAMEFAKGLLRPGRRELEVVAELEYFMRRNGSEGVPFTIKVLTGENATRTINLPGDNRIREGEIVLLDFGAVVQHYASDWTRSFAVGSATDDQLALYELVWRIERACIAAARPGVRMGELFQAAYEAMAGHRFARYFNPYLGHSIGIGSQEWPAIVPDAAERLQENMVITIEPGVYVPGVGGVRIEDELLLTASGPEILTGLAKEEFVLSY